MSLSQHGISLHISDPLIKSGRSALSERFTDKATSYSHEKRRIGGYWSARISLNESEPNINQWIQNGIGKHFETYNNSLVKIFEGFVNKINIRFGENKISIGPLLNVANQVKVTYSTIDSSTVPPSIGARDTTPFANNIDSQTRFGIWQKTISDSGNTTTGAEQKRDMIANDSSRSFPATSGDLTLGPGSTPVVTLDILGYWHWFLAYFYSNNVAGNINLSQKIIDVLTASPNNIFNSDTSKITTNTTPVEKQQNQEQRAADIFKKLNSSGDAAFNSYSIGLYNDRRLVYEPILREVKYLFRRGQFLTDKFGGRVFPWDVEPNKWILKTDVLVGQRNPVSNETLGADLRSAFAEIVKYSTPYSLSINGEELGEIDTVLARSGLGSLG